MRGRGGLNKIGVLALALLLALGALGTAYGAWVDEIYIKGSLSTSDINTSLSCGNGWEEVNGIEVEVAGTDIACDEATNPTKLNISVTNAQFNATPALNTHYYCEFDVSNAVNSFPVTVTLLSIEGSYTGVTAGIEDLNVSDVINPGTSATGQVHIYLTTADNAGEELTFILTAIVH